MERLCYEKTLVCLLLFLNGSAHDMKFFNYSEIYLGRGQAPHFKKIHKSIYKINGNNHKWDREVMQPETGNQIPSQCSAARYNLSSDGMLSEMKEVSVLSVNVYKTFRR
jgi:hypothetical protein